MKQVFTLLVALILVALSFGCKENRQEQVPQQIPIPDELFTPDSSADVKASHLQLQVERRRIDLPNRPFGLALSPDGTRLFVACAEEGRIAVIDAMDMSLVETWGPFEDHLIELVVGGDGKHVFGYGLGGSDLLVIDAGTGRLEKRIEVGANISDIVVTSLDTLLVGSTSARRVLILDTVTLAQIGEVDFQDFIGYLAVGKNGRIACAAGGIFINDNGRSKPRSGPIFFFDPSQSGDAQPANTLKLGEQTRKPVFVQDDKFVLVPDRQDNSVRVFDVEERDRIDSVDVGAGPEMILLNPKRPEAYTIDTQGRSVTVLSLEPVRRLRRIPLNANPETGQVSPDGKRLYVTLPATSLVNNRIAAIDLDAYTLTDMIPTAADPCRMVISKDGKTLFVTNFAANTLSIFR